MRDNIIYSSYNKISNTSYPELCRVTEETEMINVLYHCGPMLSLIFQLFIFGLIYAVLRAIKATKLKTYL